MLGLGVVVYLKRVQLKKRKDFSKKKVKKGKEQRERVVFVKPKPIDGIVNVDIPCFPRLINTCAAAATTDREEARSRWIHKRSSIST